MSGDSPTWLHHLVNHISQAHDLQEIVDTAVLDLRSFLNIDRVEICQFQSDGRGQVIAEAIHNNRLPSLFLLHLPQNDLLPYSRDLLPQSPGGEMVDLSREIICKILNPNRNQRLLPLETTNHFPVDSHYAQSLINMGVNFSIVKPIFHHKMVWGLLIVHHSEAYFPSTSKFKVLQMVVDQLSIAVAQEVLRAQPRTKIEQEAIRESSLSV